MMGDDVMGHYNNVTLTDEGKFKNRGHILKFGLEELKTIYENIDSPIATLSELTLLSETTVVRIKKAINDGYFDNYLPVKREETYLKDYQSVNPETTLVNEKYGENDRSIVNINDIHINIYNNLVKEEESVEQSIKVSQMKLKHWSKRIRERGAYICAKCGKIDQEHSQAHHIFSKSSYPGLACDEGNGIVLCQRCHADYHKQYTGDDVNAYTFIGWLNE